MGGELRQLGIPVIYFDAFANDYIDDPFLAIAGEIIALAKSKRVKEDKRKSLTTTAVKIGKMLTVSAVKVGVKAATLGTISSDDLTEVGQAITSGVADEVSEASEAIVTDMLRGAEERKSAVAEFRRELTGLPGLLADDGVENPRLVVIVDDLDRCTPLFALRLLERMKHFFSVPNVHFVLGVYVDQLLCSIRAAYGAGINAEIYLQKFINLSMPLVDTYEYPSESNKQKYIGYLTKSFGFDSTLYRTVELIEQHLSFYARRAGLSLRSIEKIYTNIAIVLAARRDEEVLIPPILTGLAILKTMHPALYAKAKQGELRWTSVQDSLCFNQAPEEQRQFEWWSQWWRYATDQSLPPADQSEFAKLLPYKMREIVTDRLQILPHVAITQIDRFSLT